MSETNESGKIMTAESALNLYERGNDYLREKLQENATCDCGACHLCAYNYFKQISHHEAGQVTESQNGQYISACVICKEQVPVMLYPHRGDGKIVGWLFVCAKDERALLGGRLIIEKAV